MTRLIAIALSLMMIGCVENPAGPTGLSDSGFPDVAGTYSGTLTLTITGAPGHPPMRGPSTLIVTVTQSGNEVTLSSNSGVAG